MLRTSDIPERDLLETEPTGALATRGSSLSGLIGRIVRPAQTPRSAKTVRFVRENTSIVLLVVLLIAGASVSPVFFTVDNLLNILWAVSILGIVALGQCILIITCKFDMSVAFTIGLSGVATITAQNAGVGLLPSFGIGILTGVAIGLLNGVIVVTTKANPFLVTLGSSWLVYSVALAITNSKTIGSPYESFGALGRGRLAGTVHYSVVIFLILAVALEIVFRHTAFGRSLFVIGINERVAHLSGTRVNRTVILTFVACSTAAAMAGLIIASRNGSTVANVGIGMDFESIIAVVLGGTSLFGGRGGALRTVVGVVVLGVLNNLMVLLNFPIEAQQIAKGSIFLLIVWMDSFLREDKR